MFLAIHEADRVGQEKDIIRWAMVEELQCCGPWKEIRCKEGCYYFLLFMIKSCNADHLKKKRSALLFIRIVYIKGAWVIDHHLMLH